MNKLTKYFGDSHFWRVALTLGIPIALQNLLTSSFALVDTLMVGQLGDVYLSAVGMAAQWNWLLNMIMFGICSGTSVLVSQYWGAGSIKEIRKTLGIALTFGVLASIVFMSAGIFAPGWVMRIFNNDANVVSEGIRYLRIAAFSYPAVVMSNIISTALRSTERVKIPMYVSFFTAVLNAIFNYGLIFGAFGLPQMGIMGAAIATVISSWSSPVLIILFSLMEKNILYCSPKKFFGYAFGDIGMFFKTAAPVILNETIWGSGTFVFNVIFARIGYEYYAAVTMLRTFESIAYAFFIGLCSACCVMLGKSIGAGRIADAVRDSKRFATLVPAMGMVVGAILVTFRHQLVGLFNLDGNMGEVTLATGFTIMLIYGCEVWLRNIPYIMIVGVFRSGGDTIAGMVLDTAFLWLLSLPATIIAAFVLELPFPLVFLTMYVFEDIPKSLGCIIYFFKEKWIKPVTDEGKAAVIEYRKSKKSKHNDIVKG